IEHGDIGKIINRSSNINNLEDGVVVLKELYQIENMLSYDFEYNMKSFIRKVNEKIRSWCKLTVPFLWTDPFNPYSSNTQIISTYMNSL
ncbi:14774_t:CDS:2, partial [Entrophospora sp. SA101]